MGTSYRIPLGNADSPTVSFGSDSPSMAGVSPEHRFLPGTRFGERYRIIELLGRGGMGEVYRADDLQLGQTVALWALALTSWLLPDTLISWTRLLRGRFTDPRVGRDVLIGGLAGVLVILIQRLEWLVPTWFGVAPRIPYGSVTAAFDGGRKAWSTVIEPSVFSSPLWVLLTLTALLYLFKRRWPALLLAVAVWALADGHWNTEGPWIVSLAAVLEVVLVWSVILFTLIRFGLLSMVTAFFFFKLLQRWPLVLDTTVWFAGTSLAGVLLLGAFAALAAWTSVGHRTTELSRLT